MTATVNAIVAGGSAGVNGSSTTVFSAANATPATQNVVPIIQADARYINTSRTTLPSAITVTASPFSFQNTNAWPLDIIVSGGTVTNIEFTRDAVTYYSTGLLVGVVELSASDRIRVTYSVAPTMTQTPR